MGLIRLVVGRQVLVWVKERLHHWMECDVSNASADPLPGYPAELLRTMSLRCSLRSTSSRDPEQEVVRGLRLGRGAMGSIWQ